MKKTIIDVPANIRFMSQWKEFSIPYIPHIMNKQIPGCGFTEYCITNSEDVILCSPRKILLQNKYDQHKEDVYLVVNDYDQDPGTDKDLTLVGKIRAPRKDPEPLVMSEAEEKEFFRRLTYEISDYIDRRRIDGKPVKILVTYDSFKLVKDVIRHQFDLDQFRIIVDEFQSIFTDSKFKSDTELGFMDRLRGIDKVCYVSATPMIDKYLEMLDEFKNLPYYVLDWGNLDPARIKRPNITVRCLRSVYMEAGPIIKKYLDGNFEHRHVIQPDGTSKKVESREVVFYVNSVNNITSIIKHAKLTPDQVNILVANTEENKKRIRKKLGKKFEIGKVPLRNEPRKMFTFCTRTVYLGADFYSDNARTFIISDANIDTLAVDITLDLPQIMGRQRLLENPWKDEAILYFRTISCGNKTTEEIFQERLKEKDKSTTNLLSILKKGNDEEQFTLSKNYRKLAKAFNYRDDFVAVNDNSGELVPVFNHLVRISELRAYEIQQEDYADRFSVFNELGKIGALDNLSGEVKEFFLNYDKIEIRLNKLRYLCENFNRFSEVDKKIILGNVHDKGFQEYVMILGPDVCKACGYNVTKLNKRLEVNSFDKDVLINKVLSSFQVGQSYSKSFIKLELARIYKELNYPNPPKASQLGEYFELKDRKVKIGDKWEHGFKIIGLIQNPV